MAYFVLTCFDKQDSLALRLATRPAHLVYIESFPNLKLGGPLLDDDGSPMGSLFIIETDDREGAADFAANDPYAQAGLFESFTIRPWRQVIGDLSR